MGFDYDKAKAERDNFRPRKKVRAKPTARPQAKPASTGALPSIPGFPNIPGLTGTNDLKSKNKPDRP